METYLIEAKGLIQRVSKARHNRLFTIWKTVPRVMASTSAITIPQTDSGVGILDLLLSAGMESIP